MDKEYKLKVMLDKGDPTEAITHARTDTVRVRWFLEKSGAAEKGLVPSANVEEIINTFKGVLENLPGVDMIYFTRYTAELRLAEHVTAADNFMKMLKIFIERDLVTILGGRTQIALTTEVTVL